MTHRRRACFIPLVALLSVPVVQGRQPQRRVGPIKVPSLQIWCRGGAAASSTSSGGGPYGYRTAPLVDKPSSPGYGSDRGHHRSSLQNRSESKEMMNAFLTRDSRNSFVARVYAILGGQLAVTALSVLVFGTNPQLAIWMRTKGLGGIVPMLSLLLSTVAWFIMCASAEARRVAPLKWQLLGLFTAGEAITVGFISSFYQFRSVMSAMLATAVASGTVSLYVAKQKNAKYDLSQWGQALSSFGLIFLVYGLIAMLQSFNVIPPGFMPYNEMLYSLAGACLFSFYLAYHTKLIVAGKHAKYQMNEKDYVFGAMTLYNDIINMFIYTLRLIGEDRDR